MASPNARLALLRNSPVYTRVPNHLRQLWLDQVQSDGARSECPDDLEVFESEKDCLSRLNSWGLRSGCGFVTLRSRLKDVTPTW